MERLTRTVLRDGATKLVYQPGDSTRYEIYVIDMDGQFLIAWSNRRAGGVSMVAPSIEDLFHTYVAEKMGLDRNQTDMYSAKMICACIEEWLAV